MPNVVVIEPGVQEKSEYKHYEVEGINVYIKKIFKTSENISFTLSSLGIFSKITIHGFHIS